MGPALPLPLGDHPGVTELKKTDSPSPSSYQALVTCQLVVGLRGLLRLRHAGSVSGLRLCSLVRAVTDAMSQVSPSCWIWKTLVS